MDKKKILVADDEVYVRLLLSSILGKDYSVLEAGDGEEAVHIARTQKPHLILMDVMMPKLDGVGACNILKSAPGTRDIPVIMISALEHELDQQYAMEMGADGYITKPFSSQYLADMVRQFLVIPE